MSLKVNDFGTQECKGRQVVYCILIIIIVGIVIVIIV